eukprot:CAMPEP_0198724950 /NCGR_PEP_ID=MMETSP1475-20131203/2332_1 /TAXON_ID= ORGANISM="Unidentified sp., Strain CCMP1999" /NCGR_SAMPLE_ID=MMETSP1475 /ASSEMBLY_ACC=CAM_ASM_001111 /LENGTH=241 /DNA_ID=CAMNT_0044486599 /DNA_START=204 /DNA_END=925 /DNA_ORIENTATION=+
MDNRRGFTGLLDELLRIETTEVLTPIPTSDPAPDSCEPEPNHSEVIVDSKRGAKYIEIMVNGEKQVKCAYDGCSKVFKKLHAIYSHSRQHTGETPYKCPRPECGLRFTWRSSLGNHMRYHREEESALLSPVNSPPTSPANRYRSGSKSDMPRRGTSGRGAAVGIHAILKKWDRAFSAPRPSSDLPPTSQVLGYPARADTSRPGRQVKMLDICVDNEEVLFDAEVEDILLSPLRVSSGGASL